MPKKFIVNLGPMLADLDKDNSVVGSVLSQNGDTVYVMATRIEKEYRQMMGAEAVPIITPNNVEARKDARTRSESDGD